MGNKSDTAVKRAFRAILSLGITSGAAVGLLFFGAGSATGAAGGDSLGPGETLIPNQRLVSGDGRYVLVMQGDGNLVEYAPNNVPIWASGTGTANSRLVMQGDGNLVIYTPAGTPVWATATNGTGGSFVQLQNDANIVVYTGSRTAVWDKTRVNRDNTTQVRYAANQRMLNSGWDQSQWRCLDDLWNKESGWRWNAGSPSTAYGIPQALPGTRMGSAGADWRSNPITQINWGLSYIRSRYGSPCGALNFWNQKRWY